MMASLGRNPQKAQSQDYDLIIVGGGIYGAALSLESARRGLKPLLIEKGDFGEATSWNSFRIVHGGLRYLQSLDLYRFRESVQERKWFLKNFPDLVEPLPCLMTLYNEGLYNTHIFRVALLMNALFSTNRNWGVRKDRALKAGGVINQQEVLDQFPGVDAKGLKGGALWYDGFMINSQRLLIELLRWAASQGAQMVNYMEGKELVFKDGKVQGIHD